MSSEARLRTFLEVALASIQTVVMALPEMPAQFREDGSRMADCFCELEQAIGYIRRARRCLREDR